MKDLKFRAWDKQYKRMVRVNMILFDSEEIDYDDNLNEPKSWSRFNIMQYSGLNDKNGNEIYEGDIIKVANKYIGKIVFYHGCFCFFNDELYIKTSVGDWMQANEREILGNIYENPEIMRLEGSRCSRPREGSFKRTRLDISSII